MGSQRRTLIGRDHRRPIRITPRIPPGPSLGRAFIYLETSLHSNHSKGRRNSKTKKQLYIPKKLSVVTLRPLKLHRALPLRTVANSSCNVRCLNTSRLFGTFVCKRGSKPCHVEAQRSAIRIHTATEATLTLLISFPASPGKYQCWPNQCLFTSISNPLWTTEFRASSAKELWGNL